MRTSFLIQYGGSYDALSLVHLYFVAATCCRKCTYGATTLLSANFVAAISRTNSNWFEFVQLIAATMIFYPRHKRPIVAATCPPGFDDNVKHATENISFSRVLSFSISTLKPPLPNYF